MKIQTSVRALAIKTKQGRRLRSGLAKSYASLFIIMTLLVSSTAAWFMVYDTASVTSDELELQSASSLRVNKGKQISNNIHIDDFVLDEASSVDGRNLYFPLTGSFTDSTLDMIFREGNVGDENVSYVYKNFDLTGTSGFTYVYVKSYKITVGADVYQDELEINYDENGIPTSQTIPPDCPIRIAFVSDSGQLPVVIDPSARVIDYVENSDAVESINDSGAPTTKTTNTDAFSSYYFRTGSPIFTLEGGEQKTVTMVVWLEGTAESLPDGYAGKKISVDVDIESNFVEMETITFVDDTTGDGGGGNHWISDGNPIIAMSYKDPYSTEGRYKTVIMSKKLGVDNEWEAPIPKKAVTGISFYRLSPAGDDPQNIQQGTVYNSWHTYEGVNGQLNSGISTSWFRTGTKDLQETRTITKEDGTTYNSTVYTATHGNGYGAVGHTESDRFKKWLSPCVGYWDYSVNTGGSGGSGGGGGTGGTGGDSSTGYSVGINVNTTGKDWVEQNCSTGSVMVVHLSDGTEYDLTHSGSNYFNVDTNINKDVAIEYFYLRHGSGSTTTLPVTKEISITRSYNYTYYITTEDKLEPR